MQAIPQPEMIAAAQAWASFATLMFGIAFFAGLAGLAALKLELIDPSGGPVTVRRWRYVWVFGIVALLLNLWILSIRHSIRVSNMPSTITAGDLP